MGSRHDYGAWGANGYRVEYTKPVRPAEIVDAGGMWAVPLLVGGLLGVTLMVGLSLAIFVSTRARRRELSILRALGFTGGQLSNSVRVQAVATMLAALAIGVPTGMVAGRLAWRAFASSLAVVEAPSTRPSGYSPRSQPASSLPWPPPRSRPMWRRELARRWCCGRSRRASGPRHSHRSGQRDQKSTRMGTRTRPTNSSHWHWPSRMRAALTTT